MRKRQRKKNWKKCRISAGSGTPIFDFTGYDNVAVKIRNWSGGMKIIGTAEILESVV